MNIRTATRVALVLVSVSLLLQSVGVVRDVLNRMEMEANGADWHQSWLASALQWWLPSLLMPLGLLLFLLAVSKKQSS